MTPQTPLPHLFRTEYRKIISVLCRLFGIAHIAVAEDIVSDTFLAAAEIWGLKGLPDNPAAWLYTVAKNKTKNYLKRDALFAGKLSRELRYHAELVTEDGPDLSSQSINDSQLAMIFTVCDPCIPPEAQVALALNLLCGFGAREIADAFLSNKETIYKRLSRAKEKLRVERIKIEQPSVPQIDRRLGNVLTTLYLLFNEGYCSASQDTVLRRDLCLEAMRLTHLLTEHATTDRPAVSALLSLMCFHASRFDARIDAHGETVLYEDQDTDLWQPELIEKGTYYLNRAAQGDTLSRYHLEAGIAYWHTQREDTPDKWEHILQLYNQLLLIEYSPVAALNRTYALAKANGSKAGIAEAEKLQLTGNHFYYSLLGHLYQGVDDGKALEHLQTALSIAASPADRRTIGRHIERLRSK